MRELKPREELILLFALSVGAGLGLAGLVHLVLLLG